MKQELDEAELRLARWCLEVAKGAVSVDANMPGEDKLKLMFAIEDLQEKMR